MLLLKNISKFPALPNVINIAYTIKCSKVKMFRYRHAGAKGKEDGCNEWSASRPGRALPPEKDLLYPLDRRLSGPQSWFGHRG
jgi:hypothetical protein